MTRVAIVDSGCANVASVAFAFERLGVTPEIACDEAIIREASHVVLPGVGSAPTFMKRIRERGLADCLRGLTQPCLGICLGMQAMFTSSEEGDTDTLGMFSGRVVRLPRGKGLAIPHMGWNALTIAHDWSSLMEGVARGAYVYFVHSYYVRPAEDTIATTDHGVDIAAVVARGNFFGCQFHPERSGPAGARVLHNFLSLS